MKDAGASDVLVASRDSVVCVCVNLILRPGNGVDEVGSR